MSFPFRRQIDPIYALAACIQMITGTEENQQNIYFQLVQLKRTITSSDCAIQSIASQEGELIVGPKERAAQLIQEGLNRYRESRLVYQLRSSVAFVTSPAIAVLKTQKVDKRSLLTTGHPIVIERTDSSRVRVLDPANENPIEILQMRLKPSVLHYYSLILQ